jgi:hypothetical protein
VSVNLRNTSGPPQLVHRKTVDVDEVFTVDGDVSDDSPDDAYLIGDALWPKANWTDAGGRPVDTKEQD